MAALPDTLSYLAPPATAPELSDYPWFKTCAIPEGSGASKAYRGIIRPFSDDDTARRILRAFEQDLPLQVTGGRLDVELKVSDIHRLDKFLIEMAMPCTILLLEFAGSEHPRTFLLDPPMVPRLSQCGHVRTDKSIQIDGEWFAALCVYSGSLQYFDGSRSRLEQLLDQTATYLAKYIIWLRTRQLYRKIWNSIELVKTRVPFRKITMPELPSSPDLFWNGYWPGRSAPAGPMAHLSTIRPGDECWCWSGNLYEKCCRPKEFEAVCKLEKEFSCALFVEKLMAAVRSRISIK